jgi:2'-5' RNA ligase
VGRPHRCPRYPGPSEPGELAGRASPVSEHAERARLFVALDLPPQAHSELLRWRSNLTVAESLRLVAPDALHATLCFLGWRHSDEIEEIGDACDAVVRAANAPSLFLGDALWLPPRRPRVLAVGLLDHRGALKHLQASLADALSAGGWYTPEKRPYLAHVTVARVPSQTKVSARELASPRRLEFSAPAVTLYRSRLGSGGAQYEPLAEMPLM